MGSQISTFLTIAIETVQYTFRRIVPPVVRYIARYPLRTLFHVANGILLLVPVVITGPLLALAGFTGGGIAGEE